MNEYRKIGNYLIFEELNIDSMGSNYRSAEIVDNKPKEHKLLTEVHPFLFKDENIWARINILLEGIRKSNITHLYSPEEIKKSEDRTLLIYPHIWGRTFEQVLDDSEKKDIPIGFELAFSIALAIAEQLDTGASIVVSGQKSFHGFLTPDNIIIDYDGKIFLKNYGIFPYLEGNDEIYKEMEKKYGSWLTPEFLRKEKIIAKSDVYHLGYIMYRILTGKYFTYSPGEDFLAKFENISFSYHIPSTDKEFLTNIINFFKKTLNPDPDKRFLNIKEFKEYIANYFQIEELSSVTFNLAYFMNSIYPEKVEEESKTLQQELSYTIPVKKEPEPETEGKKDKEIVEDILNGLEEQKSARSRLLFPIIAIAIGIIIIGVGGFIYITQTKKAAVEQQLKQKQEFEMKLAQMQQNMDNKYQEKLNEIEQKATTTEEERIAKEEEIKQLKEWRMKQEKKEREKLHKLQEEQQRIKSEEERKIKEEEMKKQQEIEQKRKAAEEKKKNEEQEKKLYQEQLELIKTGKPIKIEYTTSKPEKIKGKDPEFSKSIRKKYQDLNIDVIANLLIDENGNVSRVKISENTPPEIKLAMSLSLADWKYTPAQKDEHKVKVWLEVLFKISF